MANTHLYKPNLVIVISGPSGSGKSTVIDTLCKADETLQLSVSATTRKPRPREVDGVDYHFLSTSEFEKSIQQDHFLEWAEYGGNLYGTLTSEIADARGSRERFYLRDRGKGFSGNPSTRPRTGKKYPHFYYPAIIRYLGETSPQQRHRIGVGAETAIGYSKIRSP